MEEHFFSFSLCFSNFHVKNMLKIIEKIRMIIRSGIEGLLSEETLFIRTDSNRFIVAFISQKLIADFTHDRLNLYCYTHCKFVK
jgi:hypothetical protein